MGIPDHLTCLLRNLYAGQEQQLELDMEKWAGSKFGKEYIKAVYCHPANLTSMPSISCKMQGWMKHKLESRWQGEISITSDTQMAPDTSLMAESKEELKSLLMKVKEESEAGLTLSYQKTKIMASGSITSWQIHGETMETVTDFIFSGSKNHCRWWLQLWNQKMLASLKKSYDKAQLSHSVVQVFVTLWTAPLQASLSITNSWNLLNSWQT